MKTPFYLGAIALIFVVGEASAQTLAGTMTAIGVGSTLQGIGGMNYGAARGRASGVAAANNNYQNTLNGLMTDPNTTAAQQQPPPPPPPSNTATGGAGNPLGNNSTNGTGGGGFVQTSRPVSAQGAALVAQARTNPRNILSVMGGSSTGTNQLSSRPRISLRVQTTPISSSRRSGINTRGGVTGGNQQGGVGGGQQNGATGGQQQGGQGGQQGGQGGGAAPGGAGGTPPPPVDPSGVGGGGPPGTQN